MENATSPLGHTQGVKATTVFLYYPRGGDVMGAMQFSYSCWAHTGGYVIL
jgi:hypothetical protein